MTDALLRCSHLTTYMMFIYVHVLSFLNSAWLLGIIIIISILIGILGYCPVGYVQWATLHPSYIYSEFMSGIINFDLLIVLWWILMILFPKQRLTKSSPSSFRKKRRLIPWVTNIEYDPCQEAFIITVQLADAKWWYIVFLIGAGNHNFPLDELG